MVAEHLTAFITWGIKPGVGKKMIMETFNIYMLKL